MSRVARRKKPKTIGRPSNYRPEYASQAAMLCLRGATDAELARQFDVSEVTINAWKKKHPDFLKSLKAGKEEADAKVAASLYRRAIGTDRVPADVTACIFWLKNRRPAEWRDRQAIEHTGRDGAPIEVRVDELRNRISSRITGIASRMGTPAERLSSNGKS